VEYVGTMINELLTIVVCVVIFLGVYKVFQIATDICEIKDIVAGGRRVSSSAAPLTAADTPLTSAGVPGLNPEISKDLIAEDSAAAYAEQLLRAVNAEAQRAENAPHEVR
jgi:hypothetical protein